MKHKLSIILILLGMFLLTQFIGIVVVANYLPSSGNPLPFGLEVGSEDSFLSIIFSFILAFLIIFALMKYKWKFVMKIWFFLVVAIAIAISLNAFLMNNYESASLIALGAGLILATYKIYRPNPLIHNFTELLIYPGIAAIFVPILGVTSIIILLILISIYDMWAVWKVGIMQKMAKFQMEELNVFGGFLIPTVSKRIREQIRKIKQKYKGKRIPKNIQRKKFRVSLAILGGGDVVFPIITAGIFLRTYGILSALLIIAGAFIGLSYLFLITKKRKAYPAMPYITAGIFLAIIAGKIFGFY